MTQTGCLDMSESDTTEIRMGDTSTFDRVTFPTPFPAGTKVIVLAQTQTFNGPHTPGIRLHDVNEEGFLIRFNEIVSMVGGTTVANSDGRHTTETVGWVAYSV